MAWLLNLLVVSAALGMSTVVAINFVPDKEEVAATVYPLVRRESTSLSDLDEKVMVKPRVKDVNHDIIPENRQFVLMADGADTCSGNGDWLYMSDEICRDASQKLLSYAVQHESAGYFLNNSQNATQPHPSACFYEPSVNPPMKYNPLASHATTRTGRKVCLRAHYINGTLNQNSDAGVGCLGDSQPILEYDACWAATIAFDGGAPCLIQEFKENRTNGDQEKPDKPHGCYRLAATLDPSASPGCFGFNPIAPTGSVTDSMPVCENIVPDAGKVGGSATPSPSSR